MNTWCLMDKLQVEDLKEYSNELQRKTDFLIKRIRRIQAKQLERHTSEQLRAFVKHQHNRGNIVCQNSIQSNHIIGKDGYHKKEKSPLLSPDQPSNQHALQHHNRPSAPSTPTTATISPSIEAKIKSMPLDDVKSLSPATLVNLVRKFGPSDGKTNNNAKLTSLHHPLHQTQQTSPSSSTTPTQTEYDQNNSLDSHTESLSTTQQLTSQSHPETPSTPINRNNSSSTNSVTTCESQVQFVNGCVDSEGKYFDPKETEKVRTVVGSLKNHLRHLEIGYDSDATESSSGGESCDENEFSSNDIFHHREHNHLSNLDCGSREFIPIQERPEWKWLNDRSAIASRWTWLQAQVADLEFKIRQQNEMYRQLRATKGSIAFFCKDSPPSSVSSDKSKVNLSSNCLKSLSTNINGGTNATSSLTTSGIPTTTSSNSYDTNTSSQHKPNSNSVSNRSVPTSNTHNQCGNNEPSSEEKDPSLVESGEKEISHCARTLPLKHMRKRKLIRSYNALAGATRKIARYSTVQCSCNHYPRFVSPCVLCNGRYSYIPVIDTDCMPNYERYALLDPSYHPVLSTANDVPLGFHFSKILKKETVQKAVSSKHSYKRRSNHSADFPYKFGPDGKKLSRRKSQAIISSTKLKRKYDGTTKKKYGKAKGSRGLGKRTSFREKHDSLTGSGDDRTDSPSPSPLSSENSSVPIHRRRRSEQYAYDINNIVIPYSIASTTRVEKLKYKEIDTPKWRCVDIINACVKDDTEETDEDTSDEVFTVRHFKCEIDEKKQFSSYLRNHGAVSRGRGARGRLDSARSESGNSVNNSGHNNPVNLNESTQNIDISSQDSIVTAPINFLNENDSCTASGCPSTIGTPDVKTPTLTAPNSTSIEQTNTFIQDITTHGKPAKTTDRHRTSSSSKREDSVEEENYIEVTPYEKRTFPISEAEYEEMLRI